LYQTTIVSTVLLSFLLFIVPKRHFLLPFILAACFIPTEQRVIIFDLDFPPLRILIVVGVLRLLLRGELRSISWNGFDKLVLSWALVGAMIYVTQWHDMRALIYKCGVLFDIIGLYWLYRQTIRSWHDIVFPFKVLAICCLILVPLVAYEWRTGTNPFGAFGRVGTAIREGEYRCQASFPHSIMLGLFWATIWPIFIALSKQGRYKLLYWAAAAASVFIIFATWSSTPIMTWLIVLAVLFGYRWRGYVGCASWGFFGSLIALHIVMEAPVWHLIGRIGRVSIIRGSTSWHRFNLIDQGIKHFSEWALLGCRSTAHWGWGLQDVTNQYLAVGVGGGLITLAIFLLMIWNGLRNLLHTSLRDKEREHHFLLWCFFVSMIGHCVAFFGVAYFGQIHMLLYLTFAIIAAIFDMSNPKQFAKRGACLTKGHFFICDKNPDTRILENVRI